MLQRLDTLTSRIGADSYFVDRIIRDSYFMTLNRYVQRMKTVHKDIRRLVSRSLRRKQLYVYRQKLLHKALNRRIRRFTRT